MVIALGRRQSAEGLVELMLECHGRIRSFAALAEAIAERPDATDAERRDACERCHRYFSEALPLHVADEDLSLVPRLHGKDPFLDAALAKMHAEHGEHVPLLSALLQALKAVAQAPSDESCRRRLGAAAKAVAPEFERHLEQEERLILPAIARWLSAAEQAAVVKELRARRTTSV